MKWYNSKIYVCKMEIEMIQWDLKILKRCQTFKRVEMIKKKKPDRITKFQPKCILTDRQPAYTQRFLIPCCWWDNPWAMRDKNIQKFFDPKQHIDKHESVMDIARVKFLQTFGIC